MTVDVVGTDGTLDSYFRVYDSRGNLVAIDDDSGTIRNSHVTFHTFQDETYFIEVSGYNDQSVGAYQVSVQLSALPPVERIGPLTDSLFDGAHWSTTAAGVATARQANGGLQLSVDGAGAADDNNTATGDLLLNLHDNIEFDLTAQLGLDNNLGSVALVSGSSFVRLRTDSDGAGGVVMSVDGNGYTQLANLGPQATTEGASYHISVVNTSEGLAIFRDGTRLALFAENLLLNSVLRGNVISAKSAPRVQLNAYDNFDDNSIDTNKWDVNGGVAESSGALVVYAIKNGNQQAQTAKTLGKTGGQGIHGGQWTPSYFGGPSDDMDIFSEITDDTNYIRFYHNSTGPGIKLQLGGTYGGGQVTSWSAAGGQVDVKEENGDIVIRFDGQVKWTIANQQIAPNSYFRGFAEKHVQSGSSGNRGMTLDNVSFYANTNPADARFAQLSVDNVRGAYYISTEPVLYDNFDDNQLDSTKFTTAGTVREQNSLLEIPLFIAANPVSGYVSTEGTPDGTNLRGFKLGFNRTTEPKELSGWDTVGRMRLTNGADFIEIEWNLSNNTLHMATGHVGTGASAYGNYSQEVSVPAGQIPDGTMEVRERGGNIELLHDGAVKLTIPNQTVRAGSYFTFEGEGQIPGGGTPKSPPQDFVLLLDNLVLYHDPVPSNLRVTPSLKSESDTGASTADHVTNQLSIDFEWAAASTGTQYQWREGELLEDGSISFRPWSGLQSSTTAHVDLPHGSIHVFSVRPVDASGIVGQPSSRAIVVDTQGPKVVEHTQSDGPFSSWTFTYDETIDPASVALSEVVSFVGPNGDLTSALTGISSSGNTVTASFAQQTAPGTYELTIGPDVRDVAGNLMDQDDDGTAGEASEDRFTASTIYVNKVPTISDIADLATDEDTLTGGIAFTVGDVETPAGSLTVSGSSSNTVLVPDLNIVFGGSEASRTLIITPAANQLGTTTITVTVSDGAATASDTFVLTVNPVNDAPTNIVLSTNSVGENEVGATIGAVTVTDQDANDTHTFVVSDNRFEIAAGQLKLKAGQSLDFEATPSIRLDITATDAGGLNLTKPFTITVTNVNEVPTAIILTNAEAQENTPGVVIGQLAVTDEDVGDAHSLTVMHDDFELDGDLLRLKEGRSFRYDENDSTIIVPVKAVDAGGLSYTEQIAIVVLAHPLPWQNEANAADANADGSVAPVDALVIINYINEKGTIQLPVPPPTAIVFYYDTNGDGFVSPVDVLIVINLLNSTSLVGEGEFSLPPLPIQQTSFIGSSASSVNPTQRVLSSISTFKETLSRSMRELAQDDRQVTFGTGYARDLESIDVDDLVDERLGFQTAEIDEIFAEWPAI
jgi:hypothetical protein